jgi:mono/diheme cytochrome c family protein
MRKLVLSTVGIAFVIVLALSITPMQISSSPDDLAIIEMQEVKDLNSPMMKGKAIYEGKGSCSVCHQVTGLGLPGAFPPLANADYLLADKNRAIKQTMYGSAEPIVVNGTTYPGGLMTVPELTDEEVANVVTYILNSWGNDGGTVTVEEVQAQRN